MKEMTTLGQLYYKTNRLGSIVDVQQSRLLPYSLFPMLGLNHCCITKERVKADEAVIYLRLQAVSIALNDGDMNAIPRAKKPCLDSGEQAFDEHRLSGTGCAWCELQVLGR